MLQNICPYYLTYLEKKFLLIFIFDKLSCIYFDETPIGDVLIRQTMEELHAICREVQDRKILNVDM